MIATNKIDAARGIPMAMLFGFSVPVCAVQPTPKPIEPPSTKSHIRKVSSGPIVRCAEIWRRIGPCEASAIMAETGCGKSHTNYVLLALLELGVAERTMFPANRRVWRATDNVEAKGGLSPSILSAGLGAGDEE